MASGLVFGVELVPEGGRLEVEGKGNRIRGSFLTDLQKDGEKAIDAVGIDAILGGERAHAVVSPVEYAVGVDGEQLHTCKILSLNGIIAAGRLLRFIFMAGRSAGAEPASVPMADYTTSLTLHGIITCTPAGTDRRRDRPIKTGPERHPSPEGDRETFTSLL